MPERAAFPEELDCRTGITDYRGFRLTILRGQALPSGASRTPHGVNFAIISRHATDAWLVINLSANNEKPLTLRLDPEMNRTGDVWHVRVEGLPETFFLCMADGWPARSATSV